MAKRIVMIAAILLVGISFASWAAGGQEGSGNVLKITADYIWRNSPPAATDTRVVDYFNKKIVADTGVEATWQNSALTNKTGPQLIQEWTTAGTLPEVIQYGAILQEPSWSGPWIEQKLSRIFTADTIKKYMPKYTARLKKYGVTVEEVLAANKFQGGGKTAENWYIPMSFGYGQLPGTAKMDAAKATGINYYAVGLRDDILKKIFPNAKTSDELKAVFAKNGKLTIGDVVNDIPMKNLDDLYQYFKKVKAMNLKVGDKPVIPAALCAQSEALGSIDWSLRTIIGYHWQWPIIYMNEKDNFKGSQFLRNMADYGEYLRWWNKLYNEGMLDPEIFVMKNDQYFAKVINGEYAVVNFWAPITDAIKTGQERGYGYRYFPLFYGQLKPIYNNQVSYTSLQASPLMVTTKVSDENLPKVLAWIDWYMSDEHDLLAYWGTPDMYTGTGKDRRYKADYKDLEEWGVYGVDTAKNGVYYGLQHTYLQQTNEYTTLKLPIGAINFFGQSITYPEAPYFVYPKDPAKIASLTNVWTVSATTVQAAAYDEIKVWVRANGPNNEVRNLPHNASWEAYQEDHSAEFSATVVKMVTGPVADFDKNWANYQRLWKEAGTPELEAEAQAWMTEYYKTTIVPNIIK